jgi:hypothetical protein
MARSGKVTEEGTSGEMDWKVRFEVSYRTVEGGGTRQSVCFKLSPAASKAYVRDA